jgi:hypothetical protein
MRYKNSRSQNFLSKLVHKIAGLIYVAFGSNIMWDLAPDYFINALMDAFNELEQYNIIFAYKGPKLAAKSHIKFMEWAPQNAILSHKRTILFMSHGGIKRCVKNII